ncbi:hypothetical protein I6E17_03630 [Fusobacterium perfoetens]|uniref:LuxR C-terminal-related transcriptional regulator n=1 Tax=Fusobacterium perfoetens TaxID=852 RepID=UPI001F3248D1|nr:LuxR C-terminal-related transcriptional regulator [Fusobacterium perfoetens]MCF2625271.1 hypothetical protein [Fusobacterium perfoetens]
MTDDVSSKDKIIAYLKLGKSNKEIAELCSVSVRTVERHKKSLATNDSDTKNDKRQNDRVKREQAKILVEEGHTLKEAAALSGTSIDTLKKISSKENLQQSQLEYLKKFREEQRERIKANKLKRLSLNEEALYSIEEEINSGDVGKATFEKIKLSEEIEQLIFEKNRIERLERLEIDRKKLKENDDENDDKVIGILEKIGEALND